MARIFVISDTINAKWDFLAAGQHTLTKVTAGSSLATLQAEWSTGHDLLLIAHDAAILAAEKVSWIAGLYYAGTPVFVAGLNSDVELQKALYGSPDAYIVSYFDTTIDLGAPDPITEGMPSPMTVYTGSAWTYSLGTNVSGQSSLLYGVPLAYPKTMLENPRSLYALLRVVEVGHTIPSGPAPARMVYLGLGRGTLTGDAKNLFARALGWVLDVPKPINVFLITYAGVQATWEDWIHSNGWTGIRVDSRRPETEYDAAWAAGQFDVIISYSVWEGHSVVPWLKAKYQEGNPLLISSASTGTAAAVLGLGGFRTTSTDDLNIIGEHEIVQDFPVGTSLLDSFAGGSHNSFDSVPNSPIAVTTTGSNPSLSVVELGDVLLDGSIAPAKAVPFGVNFANTPSAEGKQLLSRIVEWLAKETAPEPTAFPWSYWNGSSEIPLSSVARWDGSSEIPGTLLPFN